MENSKNYYQLNILKGEKKVVLGNHDRWQDVPELLKYVNGVAGIVDYKGYSLTHAHIHHENKLSQFNVYNKYQDSDSKIISTTGKYWNVDAKLIDFKPKTIEELNKIYNI